MNSIIWRNRANAILGLMVALLPLTGFPGSFKTFLFILLGGLIFVFGFTGSHNKTGDDSKDLTSEKVPELITEDSSAADDVNQTDN